MERNKHGRLPCRLAIYLCGLGLLAFGTTLSTRTGLGVACITSAPAALSAATGWNLSVLVFLMYSVMITAQFLIKGKNRAWTDLLQLPVNMAFSLFLEWFGTLFTFHFEALWQNLLLMAVSPVILGTGVCLMVNMKMPPNPPDGLVYTVSEVYGKDMGLVKNLLDSTCVAIALAVDLIGSGRITTVGVGTVFSMIFIGRTVALFNRLFRVKIQTLAGLEPAGK